jgi:hypothetical protein
MQVKEGGPTSKPVEATCRQAVELLLLLALVVSLRRLLVSRFGFVDGLSRLLLCAHMIVAAVLLRRSPMSFRSLLVMFGSLLVHFLRHCVSLLFEAVREKRLKLSMVPTALDGSDVSQMSGSNPRDVSSKHTRHCDDLTEPDCGAPTIKPNAGT